MMSLLRDGRDVGRLGALRALALLVRDARALGERLVAVTGDAAVVHEEILRALVRGDEAVPLRIVEPLDGSISHKKTPPNTDLTNGLGSAWRVPDSLSLSRQGSSALSRFVRPPPRPGRS